LEELGQELELQKQQNYELRQKQHTLQQNLGDDDDDDDSNDESVTEITNDGEINRSNERRDEEKRQLLRNLDLNSCVEVRPSQLDGVGIFANREIPEGTQVFKYNCKPTHKSVDCTPEEVASLLPEAQRMVKKFFLQKEDGCYPVPKHGMACALGLSFLVNSSYFTGSRAEANVKFGDTKDLSGYLEIVTDRTIYPDEELVLSYKFPRSRRLPDYVSSSSLYRTVYPDEEHAFSYKFARPRELPYYVSSSSLVVPFDSRNSGSSDQPSSLQSRECNSSSWTSSRLRKRNQRIDYSLSKTSRRKSCRKSNHGRFSNREGMFWMQPDNVWALGKVHRYVSAQERNKKCKCEQAVCNCPKYTRGMYQYTVEGYISENDDEYFSEGDDTVIIGGLSGKALWN